LTVVNYPDGRPINYTFDATNRITSIKNQRGFEFANHLYKGATRLDKKNFGNGTCLSLGQGYDVLNRPAGFVNYKVSGPVKFKQFTYVYNNADNITLETDKIKSVSRSFNYDFAQRLKNANKESFNLDLAGNRSGLNQIATSSGIINNTYSTVNNLNQYTRILSDSGNIDLCYDYRGNLTKDVDSREYVYDYANRLVRANDSSGAMLVEFTYDALGRIIKKKAGSSSEVIYCNFKDQNIYREKSGAYAKYIFGAGIDEPICKINSSGGVYYFHPKALGTIVALTDSVGNVVETYDYSSFGNLVIKNASGAAVPVTQAKNLITYTGREYIPEIGKYYYRARFYDPILGRFMQRDPLGYNAGQNLYAYCDNNPINLVDPLGLCTEKESPYGSIELIFVQPGDSLLKKMGTASFDLPLGHLPHDYGVTHVGVSLAPLGNGYKGLFISSQEANGRAEYSGVMMRDIKQELPPDRPYLKVSIGVNRAEMDEFYQRAWKLYEKGTSYRTEWWNYFLPLKFRPNKDSESRTLNCSQLVAVLLGEKKTNVSPMELLRNLRSRGDKATIVSVNNNFEEETVSPISVNEFFKSKGQFLE